MTSQEKINILLVDDRPENLFSMEAIIEREDYHIIKAYSGEEALKYLLKYDFAAILLDVQMPGMDGFGTAKIIKAREKTKNIPILFITANNMDSEHIFMGYSLGAIDYILKPLDPMVLKAKVDGFVEIYKMKRKLIEQAQILTEKTRELEKAYLELSHATSNLRVSEALAKVISETSIDSMIIMDETGMILKVNPAVQKMFGYDEQDILGNHVNLFFSCEESLKYLQFVLEAINNLEQIIGYENQKEVQATRKDGSLFPSEIQFGKRYVQGKCVVACTIRDLTKKKQDEEMITYMAYHDGLTRLPNRRRFNDQLNQQLLAAKQKHQPFAILYLDIDRFKNINDSLGHLVGDQALQSIAARLASCMREGDLAARVGGDEFNIILPDTNRENALEIAESILQAFNKPFALDNYELYITTSIGISIFPYDGEDSLVLMKHADAALYRAKELGKNKYKVFHSGLNIQTYRSFVLQNDLRKAAERGELALVYQPRVEIETGIIRSAEALIRWHHPSWGTIFPAEFIPLAEETGQIVEIGEWVFQSVCQQNKAWQAAGMAPIRIAVNFSAKQFLQKNLVTYVKRILDETQLSPQWVEIEITESVMMGNEETTTETLKQLRDLGIWISIDDFGVGYSSLNYLRRFPVQTLKLDRTFIQEISPASSDSLALVTTMISLARSFKMTVVAEGVETEDQLEMLRKHHCQEYQGYLFSPPVLPEEFAAILVENRQEEGAVKKSNISYLERKHQYGNEADLVDENIKILNLAFKRTKEIYALSSREMDVFQLIVKGLSNKEISDQLFISEHTVKNHITRIFQKLEVNDRLQAMAKVYQTCIEEGKNIRAQ